MKVTSIDVVYRYVRTEHRRPSDTAKPNLDALNPEKGSLPRLCAKLEI
jgi:hypothetical protein